MSGLPHERYFTCLCVNASFIGILNRSIVVVVVQLSRFACFRYAKCGHFMSTHGPGNNKFRIEFYTYYD